MPRKQANVQSEVRVLENRLRSSEGVMRMILTVNDQKLCRAERLRRLVRDVLGEPRQGIPAYAKWMRTKERLAEFVADLKPFHNYRQQPKFIKRFIAKTKPRSPQK